MVVCDLRSDTVTQPTIAMRQAMFDAAVGDDVFDEDPSIHRLQDRVAALAKMDAGLYVPSGTMANQIALLLHCRAGDDVLLGENSHIYLYESGAGAAIAGVQFTSVGRGGHFTASELRGAIKTTDAAGHVPPSTLVSVENTHNRGGGLVMPVEQFAEIIDVAREFRLGVHIDGARIFNAAAALGCGIHEWTERADTVSICLSKGLGAPVGSVLCGSAQLMSRAKRYRKMLGGGMRQAGLIAAAGLHAIENHIPGLKDDNRRAFEFACALDSMPRAQIKPDSVKSNIVIFTVDGSAQAVCDAVAGSVRVLPISDTQIRAVFHHEVDDKALAQTIDAFRRVLS
ncbi:MAG: GntG family PLP-dependent aldolase [Myxococcota bacterium]|nr:GntG family PLP-dependent aldolase [Myxococcota bacterium]